MTHSDHLDDGMKAMPLLHDLYDTPTQTAAPRANDFYAALEYQINHARTKIARLEDRRRSMHTMDEIAQYERQRAYEHGRIFAAVEIRDAAERLAEFPET